MPGAWINAPYERWSWLVLLIWLIPLSFDRFRGMWRSAQAWQIAAVVLAALSAITDLRLLAHVGLSLLVFGASPASRRRHLSSVFWLMGAIAWMPASGWLLSSLPAAHAAWIRVVWVALVTAWTLNHMRRRP